MNLYSNSNFTISKLNMLIVILALPLISLHFVVNGGNKYLILKYIDNCKSIKLIFKFSVRPTSAEGFKCVLHN